MRIKQQKRDQQDEEEEEAPRPDEVRARTCSR